MPDQPPSGRDARSGAHICGCWLGTCGTRTCVLCVVGVGLEEVSGGVGMCLPPLRDTQVVFGVEGAPCRFAPSGLPVSRSPPAVHERRCVKCPSLKCAINLRRWSHARPQPLPVPARTHQRQVYINVGSLRGDVACRSDEGFH